MKSLNARPHLLKQANLSLIRRAIKNKGTATRAEIAEETKISSTTVRSLLSEMMENGEIESIGYDKSSGGRKAERYRFQPDRYYGAAVCIMDKQVYGLLVNICGEIAETTKLEVLDGNFEAVIFSFLDDLIPQREIKSIGIGVPGVVEGGTYWRMNEQNELLRLEIGDTVAKRYRIPVILENDLNATVIGVERCYEKKFPCEKPENINMAYLYFEKGCVSAGFIAGGKVVRGCNNSAGELSLLPLEEGKVLEECISEASEDVQYTNLVIKVISWICAILNPQYVVLGGPNLRRDCIGRINDGLFALLPKNMFAEILYSSDMRQDYLSGMAYLTARGMFDEVQFRKEFPCL